MAKTIAIEQVFERLRQLQRCGILGTPVAAAFSVFFLKTGRSSSISLLLF